MLFQTLLKSANPNQQMNQPLNQQIQYGPMQSTPNAGPAKPGYFQNKINGAINSVAQTFQPKFSVGLQPSIGFGQ